MIRTKKVLTRLHEKLDESTTIPFPENQQIRYIRKIDTDRTVNRAGTKRNTRSDLDHNDLQALDSAFDAGNQPIDDPKKVVKKEVKVLSDTEKEQLKNIQVPTKILSCR